MALTNGGSVPVVNAPTPNPKGSPSKNIVGAASAGPNTAKFSDTPDTNWSGNVPNSPSSNEDATAAAHFGSPSAPAAPRVAGVAADAAAATTGDGSSASVSPAFIDGSTFTNANNIS